MQPAFSNAANPSAAAESNKLVFTFDWHGTLTDTNWNFFDLSQLANDAAAAGHRVIITTSIPDTNVLAKDLAAYAVLAADHGYKPMDCSKFELMNKATLKMLNLKSDYSFDNDCIAQQFIKNYVDAGIEITVKKDFSTFPFTIDQVRERAGLPAAVVPNIASAPAPSAP